MPINKIAACKNVYAFVSYMYNGKAHDDAEDSVRCLIRDGIFIDEYHEATQLTRNFNRFYSGRKNESLGVMVLISFHPEELDPDDPSDQIRAAEFVRRAVELQFPGYPAAIAIQNDGRGHCLHGHVFVSSKNWFDGKPLTKEMTNHYAFNHVVDQVCEEMDIKQMVNDAKVKERVSQKEAELKALGKTSFKEELRNRIKLALEESPTSFEAYASAMAGMNVTVTEETVTRGKKKGRRRYRYRMEDIESNRKGHKGEPLEITEGKLGGDYGYDELQDIFRLNRINRKMLNEELTEEDIREDLFEYGKWMSDENPMWIYDRFGVEYPKEKDAIDEAVDAYERISAEDEAMLYLHPDLEDLMSNEAFYQLATWSYDKVDAHGRRLWDVVIKNRFGKESPEALEHIEFVIAKSKEMEKAKAVKAQVAEKPEARVPAKKKPDIKPPVKERPKPSVTPKKEPEDDGSLASFMRRSQNGLDSQFDQLSKGRSAGTGPRQFGGGGRKP